MAWYIKSGHINRVHSIFIVFSHVCTLEQYIKRMKNEQGSPFVPLFCEVLHQVHRHSLNYFKAVLTKLFRLCQSFLSIRYNHLNLSSGLQAHSDHMRKAGEEKN